MVAGRRRELFRNQTGDGHNKYDHVDLENGNGQQFSPRPRQRFRDAIEATISENHAIQLKRQLLENVDHNVLEKFRKSDEEVCSRCSALFF